MAQQTRIQIKKYFQTGDIPTQQEYAHLVDSYATLTNDTNSGSLILTGSFKATEAVIEIITASGDISSSGDIEGDSIRSHGKIMALHHVGSSTSRLGSAEAGMKTRVYGENIWLDAPVTASGNISASGVLTVNNIELPPDGAIRPTANNNTISFRAADHGSGEFMEIGDDLFKVYQQGVSTFNITRNGDHEGTITLNDSNKNFDVIIKSDATNDIFTADASADLIKTRGRLNIGNLTVPSAAGGLNQTTHELYVTGSTFLSGSLESSGEISGIINGGKF